MTPYTEIITQSKTWSCPENGTYKVICVGPGGDATTEGKIGDMGQMTMKFLSFNKGQSVSCTVSTNTAFGNYINCAKGESLPMALAPGGYPSTTYLAVGGVGGYTPDGSFGGAGGMFAYEDSTFRSIAFTTPQKNGGIPGNTGFGYGAGGGFVSKSSDRKVTVGSLGVIIIQRTE